MALPVAHSILHQWQSHGELGGVDVHQNARTPSAVLAVARRHRDARPCCSACWESTHWITWREHHGEDERDDCEPRTSTSTLRGVLGPPLVRRGFLWWWSGLVLLVLTSEARIGQPGRDPITNSDPQIYHKKPPLSPAPRPSSIAAQYRDTSHKKLFPTPTYDSLLPPDPARVTRSLILSFLDLPNHRPTEIRRI